MLGKQKISFIIVLTMLLSAAGIGLAIQFHQQRSQIATVDAPKTAAISAQETSITSSDHSADPSAKDAVSSKNTTAPMTVKTNPVANSKPAAVKRAAVPAKTTIKKTTNPTAASRKTTSSASSNQTTSTTTPSRGGQRTLTMLATAYDPGPGSNDQWAGISYLGTPLHYGIVAVDPDVIPLGSHLYIEGYGEGYAADTGGAIKGNRIDLCYDTYDEAMNFGMKYVKVTILD
ncbi:MAG: 3D domain-containing protein [Methylocystaceae bacterium]